MDCASERSPLEKRDQGHETLLIVEDEPLMVRLLERFFSRHGYKVLVAADGEQAIEVYCRYKLHIDAVLLDARLPKTTGEEVFRRMKDENPAVRQPHRDVGFTAHDTRRQRSRDYEALVDAWIDRGVGEGVNARQVRIHNSANGHGETDTTAIMGGGPRIDKR